MMCLNVGLGCKKPENTEALRRGPRPEVWKLGQVGLFYCLMFWPIPWAPRQKPPLRTGKISLIGNNGLFWDSFFIVERVKCWSGRMDFGLSWSEIFFTGTVTEELSVRRKCAENLV
jgi:hypothetical protein